MLLGTIIYVLVLFVISIVLFLFWILTKKHVFGILLALLWLAHCVADRKVYGSFWEEFYDGYIIAHTKCSRPGFQTFGWKSEKENTFRITEVWQYASQHEWHLRDSLVLAYDSLNMRLKSFGTEFGHYPVDYSFIIFRNEVFKYLEKQEDYHIYFFETNVWAEEPGPLSTTLINGFVVINSNGKQMRVFHYWGEV